MGTSRWTTEREVTIEIAQLIASGVNASDSQEGELNVSFDSHIDCELFAIHLPGADQQHVANSQATKHNCVEVLLVTKKDTF